MKPSLINIGGVEYILGYTLGVSIERKQQRHVGHSEGGVVAGEQWEHQPQSIYPASDMRIYMLKLKVPRRIKIAIKE